MDRGKAGVSLYRVGADRRALLLAAIPVPRDGGPARATALSSGPKPDVCVVWSEDEDEDEGEQTRQAGELRCYPFGDLVGRQVPVVGAMRASVALRSDGRALAWIASAPEDSKDDNYWEELVTAGYDRGRVTQVERHVAYAEDARARVDLGCASFLAGVTWAGSRLLVECSGENDYPGGLQLQAEGLKGASSRIDDEQEPPYNYLTEVGSAEATSGLALQGEYCEIECPDGKEPEPRRAVRFSLSTGRVLEVIATPARERYMESASGGPKGIVYVTRKGERDLRVYLRLPGEKHGVVVTGLPADVVGVVAQP